MIVTVLRAKHLLIKGKNGHNNCFVTIALGKEKYQTTIKEKSLDAADWHEECELAIPTQGNRAELIFTVLHRNKLGLDDFIGQAVLPLCDMDVYESPRSKWCTLQAKQGKENKKERGELEVRIQFTVKAGSLRDLSKAGKSRSSINNLIGGSLLSLGTLDKRKSLKGFTKSLGNKFKKNKFKGSSDDISSTASTPSLNDFRKQKREPSFDSISGADPGVISENEDELILDNLSQKSSNQSLNFAMVAENNLNNSAQSSAEKGSNSILNSFTNKQEDDEWNKKLFGRRTLDRRNLQSDRTSDPIRPSSIESSPIVQSKIIEKAPSVPQFETIDTSLPEEKPREASFLDKIKASAKNRKGDKLEKSEKFGKNTTQQEQNNVNKIKLPPSVIQKYEGKSREEIILMNQNMELEISSYKQKVKELEDYLDVLLLRVMEREPRILQNPYSKPYPAKSG